MNKPLTPSHFDRLLEHGKPDRIIWTAGGIAARLGTGEDYVRKTLAHMPGNPIRKKGGRLYAFEAELMAYFKKGDAA